MHFSTYLLFLSIVGLAFVASEVSSTKDPIKKRLLSGNKIKVAELEKSNKVSENDSEMNKADEVKAIVEKEPSKTEEKKNTTIPTTSHKEVSNKNGTTHEKVPKTLVQRLASFLQQSLSMLGVGPTGSERRKNRGLEAENMVEDTVNYRDEVRTTVGAVLGRPECIRKAACRAGKYLKTIKGKEIIIVILEKLSPNKWNETIRMVKESAIYNDECEYKCLEE